MNDIIPFWAWSWLLTAVGIAGLLLAGSKRKIGWAVGLGAQVLWIAYSLATEQHGFLFSALAYGSVYLRNWMRWHREAHPRFTVQTFTSVPGNAYDRRPRATAVGIGPANVGDQFTHDGIEMVVTTVYSGTGGQRWEALDKRTWAETRTIRDI